MMNDRSRVPNARSGEVSSSNDPVPSGISDTLNRLFYYSPPWRKPHLSAEEIDQLRAVDFLNGKHLSENGILQHRGIDFLSRVPGRPVFLVLSSEEPTTPAAGATVEICAGATSPQVWGRGHLNPNAKLRCHGMEIPAFALVGDLAVRAGFKLRGGKHYAVLLEPWLLDPAEFSVRFEQHAQDWSGAQCLLVATPPTHSIDWALALAERTLAYSAAYEEAIVSEVSLLLESPSEFGSPLFKRWAAAAGFYENRPLRRQFEPGFADLTSVLADALRTNPWEIIEAGRSGRFTLLQAGATIRRRLADERYDHEIDFLFAEPGTDPVEEWEASQDTVGMERSEIRYPWSVKKLDMAEVADWLTRNDPQFRTQIHGRATRNELTDDELWEFYETGTKDYPPISRESFIKGLGRKGTKEAVNAEIARRLAKAFK